MKKIGIFTIQDNKNYGNRLQNFALEYFFKSRGYTVASINASRYFFSPRNLFKLFKKFLKKFFKKNIEDSNAMKERIKKNNEFNLKYINLVNIKYLFNYDLRKKMNCFDFLSVGSDQVWNPYYFARDNIYLLPFEKNKNKKIAVAASLGVRQIPNRYFKYYKKYISDFRAISCREKSACNYFVKNFNLKATNLIDPTLAIPKSVWDEMIKSENFHLNYEYAVVFFLDEPDKRFFDEISAYSERNKYTLIDLGDENSPYFSLNAAQFISLISNAKFVFTDSFHACVFSYIFGINFRFFSRNNSIDMDNRIIDLCSLLKIDSKYFVKQNIDFSELKFDYSVLNSERKKFTDFIDSSFF